jgi:methyl-accepting chemotaxis protein
MTRRLSQRALVAAALLPALLALPFAGAPTVGAVAVGLVGCCAAGLVAWITRRAELEEARLHANLEALTQGREPPLPEPEGAAAPLQRLRDVLHELKQRPTQAEHDALTAELGGLANELDTGSQEILYALRFLEEVATEQASAVEETRRTMASLVAAADHISAAAEQVHENARQTRERNNGMAASASELDQLVREVGQALLGIDSLAERSDILALNAALQGSRAGEAGRGFVLVAEEMRRLAESVVAYVTQIRDLVKRIQQAQQDTAEATMAGVSLATETASSAESIRLTSRQQKGGTAAVTESMDAVTNLILQSKAGSQECTRAVEELGRRAGELNRRLSARQASG